MDDAAGALGGFQATRLCSWLRASVPPSPVSIPAALLPRKKKLGTAGVIPAGPWFVFEFGVTASISSLREAISGGC